VQACSHTIYHTTRFVPGSRYDAGTQPCSGPRDRLATVLVVALVEVKPPKRMLPLI